MAFGVIPRTRADARPALSLHDRVSDGRATQEAGATTRGDGAEREAEADFLWLRGGGGGWSGAAAAILS